MHWSVLALACSSVVGALALSGAAQIQQRTVYVSAVDKKGVPVTGLKPQDLTLAEEGRPRPIAAVERAAPTPKIAVILDDAGVWNTPLRDGVRSFLLAMRGKAEVGLFSSALSEWTIVDFTRDTDVLVDAIQTQTAVTRDTDHLETLMESLARKFGKDETKRPIIVVVSLASGMGPRISPRWDIVLKEILKSHTTVFAVGATGNNLTLTAAEASGGRMDHLSVSTGLPPALSGIADEILGQYGVTYDSTAAPRDGLRVKVKPARGDIKVYAPERVF